MITMVLSNSSKAPARSDLLEVMAADKIATRAHVRTAFPGAPVEQPGAWKGARSRPTGCPHPSRAQEQDGALAICLLQQLRKQGRRVLMPNAGAPIQRTKACKQARSGRVGKPCSTCVAQQEDLISAMHPHNSLIDRTAVQQINQPACRVLRASDGKPTKLPKIRKQTYLRHVANWSPVQVSDWEGCVLKIQPHSTSKV
ncbi:hypothetical protein [Mesorhizobium sp. 128a]